MWHMRPIFDHLSSRTPVSVYLNLSVPSYRSTMTDQTIKPEPFNMEEFCKKTGRMYQRLGVPIIDLRVCILDNVAPAHQLELLDHRQEHPIQTSRLCSSAQNISGRASPPIFPFPHRPTFLILSTTMACALRNTLVLSSFVRSMILSALR